MNPIIQFPAAAAIETAAPVAEKTPTSFEVGKIYRTRSVGDYNCQWFFLVEARTAKTVTVREVYEDGSAISGRGSERKRVSEWQGDEEFLPFGRYSMAPRITSDKVLEVEVSRS